MYDMIISHIFYIFFLVIKFAVNGSILIVYNIQYELVARLGLEPRKPTSEDGVLTN